MRLALVIGLILLVAGPAQDGSRGILTRPAPAADRRVAYGDRPLQFGDLRLPKGAGPHPVAVVIHGGCWLAEYDLAHVGNLSHALARSGVATWSLEYGRVGDADGGWPGTFRDVARGVDHLRALARNHPLDLNRVVVIGHSAGGHLALWVAARHRLPKESALYSDAPLPLRGVVALAPIPDLRQAVPGCDDAATKLIGGTPADQPARYRQGSPSDWLPLGVAQWIIHGERDRIVPVKLASEYAAAAQKSGDEVQLRVLAETGHFELIDPESAAWPTVMEAVGSLLKPTAPGGRSQEDYSGRR